MIDVAPAGILYHSQTSLVQNVVSIYCSLFTTYAFPGVKQMTYPRSQRFCRHLAYPLAIIVWEHAALSVFPYDYVPPSAPASSFRRHSETR